MGAKIRPMIFSVLGLFLFAACGSGGFGDTVKSWFHEKTSKPLNTRKISAFEYEEKLRGAWAGKLIGASFGAPYAFQYTGKIMDNFTNNWRPESVSDALNRNDLFVEITFLQSLEKKGLGVSAADAGRMLADANHDLTHAGEKSRKNIRVGILPPNSGNPRYNPHANDNDFQSVADLFGILNPGMPLTAVRLSEVFGPILSYGDGFYGGIFIAALYSLAFFDNHPEKMIETALTAIPNRSQYAQVISEVLLYYRQKPDDWQGCWDAVEKKWGQTDLCPEGYKQPLNVDAKLNGAYIVIGLLYGKSDFDHTLVITTRCGQDTAANAAAAAGILGTIFGYSRIPQSYTLGIPLMGDKPFESTPHNFNSLCQSCKRLTEDIIERFGGTVERLGRKANFAVPVQTIPKPRDLEQYTGSMMLDYQNEWKILDNNYQIGLQKILQEQLNGWAKGWVITTCGDVVNPGIHEEYTNRYNVFVTSPLNPETPCRLGWKGKLPAEKPTLNLVVAPSNRSMKATWLLRVKVNDAQVQEQIIAWTEGKPQWQEISVDLSTNAGKETVIVLENAFSGNDSTAYWAKIGIGP